MRPALPFEQRLGMRFYSTDFPGIGGKLKDRYEDFVVEEITPQKEVVEVQPFGDEAVPEKFVSISGEKARFICFTMQKIGLNTTDVARILASSLSLPWQMVSYAGLKDKRAITAQIMSIPASSVDDLSEIELHNIELRNFQYCRHQIQIGDLWGNRFTLVLRNPEVEYEEALEYAQQLRNKPILNYFGVQRFGVTRPNSHIIGKHLVNRDFKGALEELLVTPSEYESDELMEAREALTDDLIPTDEIIEAFPDYLRYEKSAMDYLSKNPEDYRGAFTKIPPRIQTLFVHSYQSYLFNLLVSRRSEKGIPIDKPITGDFMVLHDEPHSGRDTWLFVTERSLEEKRALVESGKYMVAAPLPGYSTKLPPCPQTDLLMELLDEEGVSLRDFHNRHMDELSSPGGLHPISIKPVDLEIESIEQNLRVSFKLRRGSYATVVMRELMKNHPKNRA
jgi:tRNA pseudouridine13 synthase